MKSIASHLRYVDAGRLATPLGSLDGTELIGPADNPVGRLDGVIIDPLARRVRYYVVESRGWFTKRHYLLSATPARFEPTRHALHVEVDRDELEQLPEILPDTLRSFSDDDVVSAMFARDRGAM